VEQTRYFVGVDLGTTNSTFAYVDAQALLEGDRVNAVGVVTVRQETEAGATYSPLVASAVAQVGEEWRVGVGAKELRRRGLLRGRQIFYSTKSEMGLGREPFYPLAVSPDFDAPWKVAGRVLQTLTEAAVEELGDGILENSVVTVPASFQLAARQDTFRAAGLAGMTLAEGALLDEPNAAFLDYLLTARTALPADAARLDFGSPRTVLVFDFGGGTCDVSVVRARVAPDSSRIELANLAVARYAQLGGDNIDAAIAEEVLLPELLRQNGMEALDLSWSEKKSRLLPQLLGTTEALKLGVCAELAAQLGLKDEDEIDRSLAAVQPSLQVDLPARVGEPVRALILDKPSLTLAQLDEILEPFLDVDFLHPQDSEMNAIRSIFGPVEDALDRAGLKAESIDGVLLAGGSSLIPQVRKALTEYFPGAALLRFPDDDRTLSAVARGAALHSFFLNGLGVPLIKPIAQESIGIVTRDGGYAELVAKGAEVPQPADGSFAKFNGLTVPADLMKEVHIVVAAESAEKVLGVEKLRIDQVKSGGEPITLRWRLDGDKVLKVEASLANFPESRCEVVLENPLCATGFRSERHRRILELEERIVRAQAGRTPLIEVADEMRELAMLQYDEGRYEKAVEWARQAGKAEGVASAYLLNLIGLSYAALGAAERAEKHYREATRVEPDGTVARFNLALLLNRQDRSQEALRTIEEVLDLDPTDGAYHAAKGRILVKLGRTDEARAAFVEGARRLDRSMPMSSFERTWRIIAAEALGDKQTAKKLSSQESERTANEPAYDAEKLPAQSGTLVRKTS